LEATSKGSKAKGETKQSYLLISEHTASQNGPWPKDGPVPGLAGRCLGRSASSAQRPPALPAQACRWLSSSARVTAGGGK